MAQTKQTPETFWAKVKVGKRNECWPWQGAVDTGGYGHVSWGSKLARAHRVAAWLSGMVTTRAAPRNKKSIGFVLHHCDNRLCCNPYHLYVGSYRTNVRDAERRGRAYHPQGAAHGNAKLTKQQVLAIRRRWEKGDVTMQQLADQYGITDGHVSNLVTKRIWRHI